MSDGVVQIAVDSDRAAVELDSKFYEMYKKYGKLTVTIEPGIESDFHGTWPMARLWRKWMQETADFMTASGVKMSEYIDSKGKAHGERPFNPNDAHELFAKRWLGVDEKGRRYSWALKSNPDRPKAPKSKRLYAMDKHQAWATERGLSLTNPENSEFRKLQMKQEQ